MNPKTSKTSGSTVFDFADAHLVFESDPLEEIDDREDYGEERWIGIGFLANRLVVVVFTEPDDKTIRIIYLRKAQRNEREKYEQYIKNRLGSN